MAEAVYIRRRVRIEDLGVPSSTSTSCRLIPMSRVESCDLTESDSNQIQFYLPNELEIDCAGYDQIQPYYIQRRE